MHSEQLMGIGVDNSTNSCTMHLLNMSSLIVSRVRISLCFTKDISYQRAINNTSFSVDFLCERQHVVLTS